MYLKHKIIFFSWENISYFQTKNLRWAKTTLWIFWEAVSPLPSPVYAYDHQMFNIISYKGYLCIFTWYKGMILPSEFHFFESVPPKLDFRWRDPPSCLLLGCLLGGSSERSEATLSACFSTRSASNASSRLDALIFSLRTGVGTKWPSPSPAKASTILAASELPKCQTHTSHIIILHAFIIIIRIIRHAIIKICEITY